VLYFAMRQCPANGYTPAPVTAKTAQASLRLKTKVWIPKKRQSIAATFLGILLRICHSGRNRTLRRQPKFGRQVLPTYLAHAHRLERRKLCTKNFSWQQRPAWLL
jgi:hypothetical protein